MYTSFFGLRELPFNNTPDPRFFYPTRDHEEALASLIYAVQERKGFVLLTGEVGAGKTLVSRMMLRHFGGRIAFASINHALQSGRDLLESICTEFELHVESGASHTQLTRALHDFLLARFARDIPVVLVVDEAQTMPIDAFEQVRMIGNLEADDAKLLQVAILGQPELQSMFASPALCQLRQRVFRSFHLPAMTRKDAHGYIRHRLSVAGATQLDVFDAQAVDMICKHSAGIPRIINTLCDNAMLSGYSANRRTIDGVFIESVIRQMMVFGDSTQRAFAAGDSASSRRQFQIPGTHSTSFAPPGDAPHQPHRPGYTSHTTAFPTCQVREAGSQCQNGPAIAHGVAGERPYSGDPRPLTAIRNALVLLARDMRSSVERINLRVDAVEKRIAGEPASPGELAPLQTRLRSVIEQGDSLLERSRAGIEEMERREGHVRKLAASAKSLIEEAERIFDGLKRAAAQAKHAEQDARKTHTRLSAQTERSKRLADKLRRLAHEKSPEQAGPSLIKEASMTPADVRGAATTGSGSMSASESSREVASDTSECSAAPGTPFRENRGDVLLPAASSLGHAAAPSSSS